MRKPIRFGSKASNSIEATHWEVAEDPVIKTEKPDINILLIEDDAIDAKLFVIFSKSFQRYRPRITHVRNIDSALDAMGKQAFDVFFLDFWLQGQSSLKFLVDLEGQNIRAPTVILSNISPYQVETLRMTSGGAIFLNKGDCSAKTLEAAVEDAFASGRVSVEPQSERKPDLGQAGIA